MNTYRCDRMKVVLAATQLEAAYVFARRIAQRDHGSTGFVDSLVATPAGSSTYKATVGKTFRRGRAPFITRTVTLEIERLT